MEASITIPVAHYFKTEKDKKIDPFWFRVPSLHKVRYLQNLS